MEPPTTSWLQVVSNVRKALATDTAVGLRDLQAALRTQPIQGFELELVGRLLQDIRQSDVGFPIYRVAVLGSYTTEPIANAARVALLREGYLAEVYEAAFNSYRQEILAPESALYAARPDAVIIAVSAVGREDIGSPVPDDAIESKLNEDVESWHLLWNTLADRLGKPVLQHVFELPDEGLLGVAERRTRWTSTRHLEELNIRLLATAPGFVNWVDVDRLATSVGRWNWRDLRLHHHGRFGFSSRFLPEYTKLLGAVFRGVLGRSRKALILDLDNTLWGGVIGDDQLDGVRLGPGSADGSAYQAFCTYVKQLGQRGVILGICSKNDLAIATEVFEKHPHMPLKLRDFAAIVCNWNDKATNLANIAAELNIDVSSFVFVDDNPAECDLIRQRLPSVHTILMDGDPALFVRKLDQAHLFDAQALSREDLKRTESYQAREKARVLRKEAGDLDAYFASLDMKARIKRADALDLPRLAQMEMKTNQFNLTTRRLSLGQLVTMAASPDTVVLAVFLSDRFTDHGLVSYVAAAVTTGKLVITDWVMSCRVFSRTLEHFTFNHIVEHARVHSIPVIEAIFNPTSKNRVIDGLLESLGFSCMGTVPEGPWRYDIHANSARQRSFVAYAQTDESNLGAVRFGAE